MEYLLEDNNITIAEDTDIFGISVDAGTKVIVVSKQGEFNGIKMRVPPPEFEALMFFNALESAAKAEVLKKMVCISKSSFDSLFEVSESESDRNNFFAACQNAMASVAFSISAIESWANKSIEILGQKDGKPTELTLQRPGKPEKKVLTNKIASDIGISIRVKLFQLVPQVFSIEPLKEHSTLRKQLINLIDERNIVMHMQSKVTVSNQDMDRVSYAIKLFKINSFNAPELILKYLDYIYSKSLIDKTEWISVAHKKLLNLKR